MTIAVRGGDDGADALVDVELLNFGGAGADLSVRGTIARMVAALDDRVATRVELDGWEVQHAAGLPLVDVAARLLEQSTVDDAMTNDDFVRALFDNGADRPADLKELSQWLPSLAAGDVTRADILLRFADSYIMLQHDGWYGATSWIADTEIGTLVRMYDVLYDRAPDQSGLNYWIEATENGVGLAAIADTFVAGAEGQVGGMSNAQYVAHLYQAGLERSGSQEEIAWWSTLLDDGVLDRGDILLDFADSAEMIALLGVMSTSIELL